MAKVSKEQVTVIVQIGIELVWFVRKVWNAPETERDNLANTGVALFDSIDKAVESHRLNEIGD